MRQGSLSIDASAAVNVPGVSRDELEQMYESSSV
jgi:hypothetical protein